MRRGRRSVVAWMLPAGLLSFVIAGCGTGAVASGSAPVAPVAAPAVAGSSATASSVEASPVLTPSPPGPAAAASQSAANAGPASGLLTIVGGTLAAGAYTTTSFQPRLHFRLADGWNGLFPDDPDEIAFDRADGTGFMAITRVTKVVDAKGTIPVPEDLIGWLAANRHFKWSGAPAPVTIAGITGAMVDGSVTGAEPAEVFAYDTGNMRVLGGDHIRYHVLPLDGPDLTVIVAGLGGDAAFANVLPSAQVTIDSLEIAPD